MVCFFFNDTGTTEKLMAPILSQEPLKPASPSDPFDEKFEKFCEENGLVDEDEEEELQDDAEAAATAAMTSSAGTSYYDAMSPEKE